MHGRPLLVADDSYLVAHHDVTGRPRKHPGAVGFGLAAGLLAELMLCGRLTVRSDTVRVVSAQPPPDALSHTVLDHVASEQQPHGLTTWLTFLAYQAASQVAQRLERAGLLERQQARRLLRTESVWVPTDMSAAAWPGTRLRMLLQREQRLELADVVLAGLVDAVGLSPQVLWDASSRTVEYRDYLLSTLPDQLRELLSHTSAAVSKAVFAHRA